uniref:NDRG family member 2 n=1 Tax=Salmo trutta TaxID=8032 RepID=A0A674A8I3_SALTR
LFEDGHRTHFMCVTLPPSQEHSIETPHGLLHVTLHGTSNTRRPAILTFHDVGLDSKSCFSPLFKFEEMQEIVKNFTLVHIDAPGQEEGATAYPMGYQYPSMEQIAEMIPAVLTYFNFRTVIGIGVGSGSYILSRFTMAHPDSVEGLVLINMDPETRGWMDWAAQKVTVRLICLQIYILKYFVLNIIITQKPRMFFCIYYGSHLQLHFLGSIWNMSLTRSLSFSLFFSLSLRCPVMLVVGDQAPHEEAAVECNSKLDPTTTSFLKMADAGGLPQLTQPSKLTEAFKYFIQGMGYMASSIMTRLSRSRTASLSSSYSMDGERQRSRTLSQSSQGGQMPPSPSHTMEVSC